MQPKNRNPKPRLIMLLVLITAFNFATTTPVKAASDSLEICGQGVLTPLCFSREQLEKMEQHQCLYSSINTYPSKSWRVGRGVKLWDLLVEAGIKQDEATLLKFTAQDGYTITLTYKELFEDKRYLFPEFKQGSQAGGEDGQVPGSSNNKVEVEPLIALTVVEGSADPAYMTPLQSLQLMLGQRAVTEQTGNLFVKYLCRVEVLTTEPDRWDPPEANPAPGVVPKGTMVTLSNLNMDDDKVYYTTDGSQPGLDSPIYNWIASRWWEERADVLGTINHPIGPIDQDTVIKAITIGPGKLDSPMVTFKYQVENGGSDTATIRLTVGQKEASINNQPCLLEAAPYVKLQARRTLVPLRFISEAFGADIAWDPTSRHINISLADRNISLTLDSDRVSVNGVPTTIDCPPELHPTGRTFVPLRFISEMLGAQNISYDSSSGVIIIVK